MMMLETRRPDTRESYMITPECIIRAPVETFLEAEPPVPKKSKIFLRDVQIRNRKMLPYVFRGLRLIDDVNSKFAPVTSDAIDDKISTCVILPAHILLYII